MANNVKINGVSYQAVPYVDIPKSGGTGDVRFFDTSSANISPGDVMAGKTAFGPNGEVPGTATVPSISQDGSTKGLKIV